MPAKIEHLGHAAFRISDGKSVVYVDPFEVEGAPSDATVVLVTHEHFDHCSADDVKRISNASTTILAPAGCSAKLEGIGAELVAVEPGKEYAPAGVKVRTVPAYNVGKKFHPKGSRWVGYVVTIGGETVYHAGDTDAIPEMRGLAPDVALLPVGGTYTMTAEEAAEAFRALGAKRGIPMHFGSVAGSKADAERFKRLTGG